MPYANVAAVIQLPTAGYYALTVKVVDRLSGNPLSGSTVTANSTSLPETYEGTYSAKLIAGIYKVKTSHIGYPDIEQTITLNNDTIIVVKMSTLVPGAIIPLEYVAIGLGSVGVIAVAYVLARRKPKGKRR